MFNLSHLLEYDDIVVQCHNYPDADTIASGFAIYSYLKAGGKKPRLIYSGFSAISKPNLVKMTQLLSIPIEYVSEPAAAGALVTADCQYGQSNVTKIDAEKIFVLDHHECEYLEHDGIVSSGLGSCSTLIWDLLRKENFDFEKYPNVNSALYYGLYTDTNSFEEISHPLDKDMRDGIKIDPNIINTLRFNNLTNEELNIAGQALSGGVYNSENNYAVFKAEACDQNILGFISDLALQVEGVDVCVVYNTLPNGYKFSVRSCTKEVMANEFAFFLAGGGGHRQKAGGFLPPEKTGGHDIDSFLKIRIDEYFGSFDLIYPENHNLDVEKMPRYIKRKIPVSYAVSSDVFRHGNPMLIRTLEGDSDVMASEDIILMIGSEGEVYPIKHEKFSRSYEPSDEKPAGEYIYSPTVKNKITGQVVQLKEFASTAIPTGQVKIRAERLMRNTKVFTSWNPNGYMSGKVGDYIAVREDDKNDVYIIRGDIFEKTYDKYD